MALVSRHDGGDHSSMGDDDMMMMGGMGGVPSNPMMQQYFWVTIGSVVAFATLVNGLDYLLLWQRLRSKNARPQSVFWQSVATTTAIIREIYSSSLRPLNLWTVQMRSPLTGRFLMVLAYFIVILVFSFIGFDTADKWQWEDIAVRIGHMGQAQFPLIFLLAGKQNIIGFFTGLGYERLNWLHRWIARVLWVTMTMHMGFFFRSWMRWDYVIVKLKTDRMTQTGFASWWILTAVVACSFAPIRRWNYELFVISHLVLIAGLVGGVMLHVDTGKVYFWICVGFFFFDRTVRFVVASLCNLPWLRLKKGLWANKAIFTSLPGNVTRVTVHKPIFTWRPGQHVFVSCHGLVPLQSHPFTISSLPSDNKLEFLIQARKGGTRRFHRYASKLQQPRPHQSLEAQCEGQKYVGLEGPYGHLRPLHQFDSVVFIAGGTGASFTIPLMRDLVRRWSAATTQSSMPVTHTIRFVWAIKSRDRLVWFQQQLEQALSEAHAAREMQQQELVLDVSVYVTCDDDLNPYTSVNESCNPEKIHSEAEVAASGSSMLNESEKKEQVKTTEVSTATSIDDANDACGPDGTCCCRATVTDENDATASSRVCCCKPSNTRSSSTAQHVSEKPISSSSSASSRSLTKSKPQLKVLTGRPHIRNIIRKVLEEADGESAVVACGPQGLQDDVRRSVVGLSDERAVHKGTGAQGVYLHVEGFGY